MNTTAKHDLKDGTNTWILSNEDGEEYWYKNDKHHRTNVPFIINSNGTLEYWVDGIEYDPITFFIKRYEYTIQT